MHAKEIFLKELTAIGRKMKKQEATASDEKSRIKNKKDPLRLKLEAITGNIEVTRKSSS